MTFKQLKSKLWFNIFIRVAVIFIVFVTVLMLSNNILLSKFFLFRQKNILISQIKRFDDISISDSGAIKEELIDINESYNLDVEIFDELGNIEYTTRGSQMMEIFTDDRFSFPIRHEKLNVIKQESLLDGIVFEESINPMDNKEYLLCRKKIDSDYYVEIKIQKQFILSSAAAANEFISFIAVICLLASLVWIVLFARRFSKPILEMNEITRDMANLKFNRKIVVDRADEIGQLAVSVNEMSSSLSDTLNNLNLTNAKLRDEIELERELDKMRKTFVANVSHELKTPLAIISGYAEGLKLNVNTENRDEYCDTIIDESQRMNYLVLSILQLSKYESGSFPIEKEVFDISDMTNTLLSRVFINCNVKIQNNVPKNSLVFADRTQIEQALNAYIENAKSHVNQGGEVIVSSEETDNKLRIYVYNSGSRIDPEKEAYIWQSFYRGDDSHKRDQTRFGLGLSIVSAIMKIHNSDFGVYNTSDGVVFWFEVNKP